jgi:hypothetical protein
MRIVTCSVLMTMVVYADFTVSNMNFAVMFVVTLNLELLMVLLVQVVGSFLQEVQLLIELYCCNSVRATNGEHSLNND